jgi:hypothetical protein
MANTTLVLTSIANIRSAAIAALIASTLAGK